MINLSVCTYTNFARVLEKNTHTLYNININENMKKKNYLSPTTSIIRLETVSFIAASNDNIGNIGGGGYDDGGDENLGSKEHMWYDDDDASSWNDAGYPWIDENL